MKITSTQLSLLWHLNVEGGRRSDPGNRLLFMALERYGLVKRMWDDDSQGDTWSITAKGINVSLLHTTQDPVSAHSVAPDVTNEITEDGVFVGGQKVESGTLIRVKGKQGKYKFLDTHITHAGRIVCNLIGPVGAHQAFTACYLEDAKLIPVPRPRRTRRAKVDAG